MHGTPSFSRSAALGLWTTLGLFTAVVASRRVAAAYTGGLSPAALFIIVILAAATSIGAWWLFRCDQPRLGTRLRDWLPELVAWVLPTLFSFTIAAGATPGQSGILLGLAAVGAVVLGVAILETSPAWQTLLMTPFIDRSEMVIAPNKDDAGTISGSAGTSLSPKADDGEIEDEIADESTTQWMTRREEMDGEAIEGTVRVHFAPGQKDTVVHVTFCPPLPSLPEVELECVDGEDWQIKTEAALPYGLRIQVRRSTAVTLEQTGRIAYLATAARPAKAA